MRKSRFTDAQIAFILRQVEAGRKVEEVCRKARVPARTPVKLRVFRVDGDGLTLGIDVHVIDGVPVKITNTARTIVACFKRRSDVGLDVAIEALRDARRQRKVDLNEVWRIAERRRALTYMRPYLEALG